MPWRSGGAASIRQPSIVTSWVAAAKAVRNAKPMLQLSDVAGAPKARHAKPERDADLGEQHPAAPPSKRAACEWRIVAVDERRPGEFESEGQRAIAHQPDRAARNPGLAQPQPTGSRKSAGMAGRRRSRAPASARGAGRGRSRTAAEVCGRPCAGQMAEEGFDAARLKPGRSRVQFRGSGASRAELS